MAIIRVGQPAQTVRGSGPVGCFSLESSLYYGLATAPVSSARVGRESLNCSNREGCILAARSGEAMGPGE